MAYLEGRMLRLFNALNDLGSEWLLNEIVAQMETQKLNDILECIAECNEVEVD